MADVNDPPDAPEDAAVFMHDISHSAWHQFTRHVAKEAASISGSSLYTAQAVDHHAAEVRPPLSLNLSPAFTAAPASPASCIRQTPPTIVPPQFPLRVLLHRDARGRRTCGDAWTQVEQGRSASAAQPPCHDSMRCALIRICACPCKYSTCI